MGGQTRAVGAASLKSAQYQMVQERVAQTRQCDLRRPALSRNLYRRLRRQGRAVRAPGDCDH
jgi:hypothetical protein